MVTFVNNGNTCYFNVLMQLILHTDHNTLKSNNNNLTNLQHNWLMIVERFQRLAPHKEFNPTSIFDFLKWNKHFKRGQAHDAHEAFLKLLDLVGEELFQGEVLEFMLTRDMPYEWTYKHTPILSLEICANHDTLDLCLREHFMPECVEDWKDSKNNERSLLKTAHFTKFPPNLVILLRQNYTDKKSVEYPQELDVTRFSTSKTPVLYDLQSVIVHKMAHYYIYCLEGGNWYVYNDECRTAIRGETWKAKDPPYMLTYKLCTSPSSSEAP